MKSLIVIALAAVTAIAAFGADVADAKRLGGGRSFGTQRQGITPAPAPAPSATTPAGAASNPVMPASPATAAARPATAGAAAATGGASRWLGPIAGIAAGLGLAALMSHLGLSEGFGSLLLIALLVFAGIFVVRMLMSRRAAAGSQPPLRYSTIGGVGAAGGSSGRFQRANEISPPDFHPTLEPWGGNAPAAPSRFPPGFESGPFLVQAKVQFHRLQEAHDAGDRETLANVMTPAMFREVSQDLDARGPQVPTDVVTLDAEVLDVTQVGSRYVASVRFKGTLREDGAQDAKPFVEIWNLEKPVDGTTGWLLAGIQQSEETA